jgi:predicted O-linked N-acetylglucosamine transferase (SPINDLY family)
VLTFVGDRWASRISASLLRHAGLNEFIALDLEGYVNRARELANAPDRAAQLATLRRTMRRRLRRAPVCDLDQFTANMERAYLRVWQCRA